MTRVLHIIGTRPEAIKMAPVIQAVSAHPGLECVVCSTGQHREMLQQVFDLFALQPDIDLEVMTENQSLSSLTVALMQKLDDTLNEVQPDWILAQGDTTTVLVASLVSYYHRIKFGGTTNPRNF